MESTGENMGNTQSLSLLVVEDNQAVAENIADFFIGKKDANGNPKYLLDFAINGNQGLALALENYYDVVILDLMLPGIDGIDVCTQIREKAARHIPILMLTARDTLKDKLTGFDVGADDYVSKPFALEELEARCVVLANRQQQKTSTVIELGDLVIDKQRQQVKRATQSIALQRIPYQILLMLVEQHPRTVSRSELWVKLWGDSPTDSDVIRSHIYQLRQALDKPFTDPLIKTIHGVGFSLAIA